MKNFVFIYQFFNPELEFNQNSLKSYKDKMFDNYRKSNQSIFGVELKKANVIKINPSLVLKFQRDVDILITCSVSFPI